MPFAYGFLELNQMTHVRFGFFWPHISHGCPRSPLKQKLACASTNNKFKSTKDITYSPLEWNKKSFRNLRKQNPFSPKPFKSKIPKILNLRNIWSFDYFTA
jgi:hypothetical protein